MRAQVLPSTYTQTCAISYKRTDAGVYTQHTSNIVAIFMIQFTCGSAVNSKLMSL